jgi:hypothetical protein
VQRGHPTTPSGSRAVANRRLAASINSTSWCALAQSSPTNSNSSPSCSITAAEKHQRPNESARTPPASGHPISDQLPTRPARARSSVPDSTPRTPSAHLPGLPDASPLDGRLADSRRRAGSSVDAHQAPLWDLAALGASCSRGP